MKIYGPTVFALFRIILGFYLTVHFIQLYPVGPELFSNQGVIDDATVLPGYGKLPILLFWYDDPIHVNAFIGLLIFCSITFMCGNFRRTSALLLYYGWICLLNRNPLISNPSLGYIGWILLACSTIPKGERLGFLLTKEQREKEDNKWELPDSIYYGLWIIIGFSYTASGLHKLQCSSWKNGTALHYVLDGPLARQNNFMVAFLLSDMNLIKMMTFGSLFLEISFLFFGTLYRLRKYYWIMIMGFHLGILATVNFSDLTVGMIMAHLFSFDPYWFDFTRKFVEKYDLNGKTYVVHDINQTDNFNLKPLSQNLLAGAEQVASDLKESANKIKHDVDKLSDTVSNYVGSIVREKSDSGKTECKKEENQDDDRINMLSWITYAIVLALVGILINSKDGIYNTISRMSDITISSFWGFSILVGTAFALMILERIFPDQELKYVPGWWLWVVIINIFQLFSVVLAIVTWEDQLQKTSYFTSTTGFHLRDHVSAFEGGLIAYLFATFIFYFWHYGRHEIYFFWVIFHQFHHSPTRIETVTSFYKHPLEIIIDSQILAVLLYSVLGLTSESSIWLSIFSGFGEYFYHMNIKTPQIIGYFFQRPESHRLHHRRNKRRETPNYSDLPLWDILGGTFENPKYVNDPTGFPNAETRRLDMIFFKDVLTDVYQDVFSDFKKFKKVFIRYIWYALVAWGALNSVAFITHYDGFRDIGFSTASSPLPLVFSAYNGVETFATAFSIQVKFENGTELVTDINVERYNKLGGPYNRKNVYGALFSHGPFMNQKNLVAIRDSILKYAVCDPGIIMKEFEIDGVIDSIHIDVLDRTDSNKKIGSMDVICK